MQNDQPDFTLFHVDLSSSRQRLLRLRQYGLEIPGLERADYRVGRVRSRLQEERFL